MSSDFENCEFNEERVLKRSNEAGIYDIRMSEFCKNYMSLNRQSFLNGDNYIAVPQVLPPQRPNSAHSPVNLSTEISASASTSDLERSESYNYSSNINLSSISPNHSNKLSVPSIGTYSNLYDSGFQQQQAQQQSCENSSIFTSSPYLANQRTVSAFRNPRNKHLLSLNGNDLPKQALYQSTPNKSLTLKNDNLLRDTFANNSSIENNLQVPSFQSSSSLSTSSRVNFHSILDLAKSDESSKNNDESLKRPTKFARLEPSNENCNNVIKTTTTTSGLTFNEHLKHLSMSLLNKENVPQEFLSKTKRKPRTQINRQQREILEYAYKLKSYPDSNEVEYLCNILGFEENVIRIWFQNKRARDKQRHL